jgi:transposase
MLNSEPINEIHRLYHAERWSMRKIARHLRLAPKTVKKYLLAPAQTPDWRSRASKLDPFKLTLTELLQQDPRASAVVLLQRLRPLGYGGGITLLRACVSRLRAKLSPPRAFVRMEPGPGERFEIDWGHFEALDDQGDKRKLYAFCWVECHSRLLYVEFTHSQSFETFVRCPQHAFQALGGVARECWYDNLATAVAEHCGTLIRFHPRFLAFAREYSFYPRACNLAAGWEKGKVERGGVG